MDTLDRDRETRDALRQALKDWQAATPEQRAAACLGARRRALDVEIVLLTREVDVREAAIPHLRGIPRQQQQNTVAKIYDRLVALHIERIELDQ